MIKNTQRELKLSGYEEKKKEELKKWNQLCGGPAVVVH